MTQNTPTLFCNTELDAEIRVVMNESNEPLFVLKDLCQSLGVVNHKNVSATLDEDEKAEVQILDPSGTKYATAVTEPGRRLS